MWLKHSLHIMDSEFYTNYDHVMVNQFFNRAKDAVKDHFGNEPISDIDAVLSLHPVKELVEEFAQETLLFDS